MEELFNFAYSSRLRHVLIYHAYHLAVFTPGLCFLRGNGTEQDEAEAVRWFEEAAANDDAAACSFHDNVVAALSGVPESTARTKALFWLGKGDGGLCICFTSIILQGTATSLEEE